MLKIVKNDNIHRFSHVSGTKIWRAKNP